MHFSVNIFYEYYFLTEFYLEGKKNWLQKVENLELSVVGTYRPAMPTLWRQKEKDPKF